MKCQCILDNNYEIVGLCDIDEFNKKLDMPDNKSWNQLNINETILFHSNSPNMKMIDTVKIGIKIVSTKIVDTPIGKTINIQGMNLTGKLLLVSGYVFQRIIYISDNFKHTLHSIKSKKDFATYIIIEEQANINKDKYCVNVCIENLSIKPISKRKIIESITISLFAKKIQSGIKPLPPIPPILKKLSSNIVFNDINESEIVKIEFDISYEDNKKLIITSSGVINNRENGFHIELLNSKTLETIIGSSASIEKNENGNSFKNQLNGFKFEYNQIIKLFYEDKFKSLMINNFQEVDKHYPVGGEAYFRITPIGLEYYFYPNDIIFNNLNEDSIARINFDIKDINNKKLFVKSTGVLNNRADEFHFELLDSYNIVTIPESEADIMPNENAELFKKKLDDHKFDYGEIVKIQYEDKQKSIFITNFQDKNKYYLVGSEAYFRITPIGLEYYFYPNFIIFYNNDKNEVVRIAFNITNQKEKKLLIISNGKINDKNETFHFELLDASLKKIDESEADVLVGENADIFKNKLNDFKIQYGEIIKIEYEKESVLITNFQDKNIYNPVGDEAYFKISSTGLKYYFYPNFIVFSDLNGAEIGRIAFNIIDDNNKKFLITSTGKVNDRNTDFQIQTFEQNMSPILNTPIIIKSQEDASKLKEKLNNFSFEYGQIIKINYETNSNSILLTNFKGQVRYYLTGNEASIKITPTGLFLI